MKDYHNTDIRKGIPAGWTHIPRSKLAQDWHTEEIPGTAWDDALIGFERAEAHGHITYGASWTNPASWTPIFDGIVIKDEYVGLMRKP